MDQNEIDGRIQRLEISEEETLIWRAVKSGYGTLEEVKKWDYSDLLKMVYFDDIEAIESHVMQQKHDAKEQALQELT